MHILVVKRNLKKLITLKKDILASMRKLEPDGLIDTCSTITTAMGEKMRRQEFDGIVIGDHFADGNGEKLYHAIRNRPGYIARPIVICTDNAASRALVKRLNATDPFVYYVSFQNGSTDVYRTLCESLGLPASPKRAPHAKAHAYAQAPA